MTIQKVKKKCNRKTLKIIIYAGFINSIEFFFYLVMVDKKKTNDRKSAVTDTKRKRIVDEISDGESVEVKDTARRQNKEKKK